MPTPSIVSVILLGFLALAAGQVTAFVAIMNTKGAQAPADGAQVRRADDLAERRMTTEQLAEAEARVRDWNRDRRK